MRVKSFAPLPPEARATFSAHHRKNPASSSTSVIMMSPMSVPEAFQTMDQTVGISESVTVPRRRDAMAPAAALQPIPRPRGCVITRRSVAMKIRTAVMKKEGIQAEKTETPVRMDRGSRDRR